LTSGEKGIYSTYTLPKTWGIIVFDDYSLEELRKYIDWTPFFKTLSRPSEARVVTARGSVPGAELRCHRGPSALTSASAPTQNCAAGSVLEPKLAPAQFRAGYAVR
jgi:hypothetical protein